MEITFVSTLGPEEESRIASALLTAIGSLLDEIPMAYLIRIETIGHRVFERSRPPTAVRTAPDPGGEAAETDEGDVADDDSDHGAGPHGPAAHHDL